MHLLYYHTNCADGFAAFTIAHAALTARGIPADQIKPYPINYGWPNQTPPHSVLIMDEVEHIYYLDYTPPAADLVNLVSLVNEVNTKTPTLKLTIIDHHEKMAPVHGWHKDEHDQWQAPAANREPGTENSLGFESVFAFTESGASLTWKHFHPGETMPDAVTLIARRDLGHAFQDTKDPVERGLNNQALDLHAALFRLLPRTLDAWTPIVHGHPALTEILRYGHALRSIDRVIIERATELCHWLDFGQLISSPSQSQVSLHKRIPAVNGLGTELVSDACQELLRRYPEAPFAASWWTDAKTGRITFSLRSRIQGHPDGHTNVCDIAKACHPDGGGHACAAGFSTLRPVPLL